MTELFLVNFVPFNSDKWECFRSTHSLASATEMSEQLRNAGLKVRIQSVLICPNGEAHTDLDKAMETANA